MNNELSNFEIFEGISWKYALHMVPVSQSQHDAIVVSNSQTHMAVMVCFKVSLGGIMFFWGTELDSPTMSSLWFFVFLSDPLSSGRVQILWGSSTCRDTGRNATIQTKAYIFLKPQTVDFQFKRTRNLRSVRLAQESARFQVKIKSPVSLGRGGGWGSGWKSDLGHGGPWWGPWRSMAFYMFLHVLLELK